VFIIIIYLMIVFIYSWFVKDALLALFYNSKIPSAHQDTDS
jgi:hypothetical protein